MKFQKARKELKILAEGKYHSIKYELITSDTGKVRQECLVYIEGLPWLKGTTWHEALDRVPEERERIQKELEGKIRRK